MKWRRCKCKVPVIKVQGLSEGGRSIAGPWIGHEVSAVWCLFDNITQRQSGLQENSLNIGPVPQSPPTVQALRGERLWTPRRQVIRLIRRMTPCLDLECGPSL
jgi:hypothetical protein